MSLGPSQQRRDVHAGPGRALRISMFNHNRAAPGNEWVRRALLVYEHGLQWPKKCVWILILAEIELNGPMIHNLFVL